MADPLGRTLLTVERLRSARRRSLEARIACANRLLDSARLASTPEDRERRFGIAERIAHDLAMALEDERELGLASEAHAPFEVQIEMLLSRVGSAKGR